MNNIHLTGLAVAIAAVLGAYAFRRWLSRSKPVKITAVVTDIIYYPVKSFRGIRAAEALVCRFGFENDRRWMVVDETGRFVTARQIPKMVLCEPSFVGDHLVISAPNAEPLTIPLDRTGPICPASVWSYNGEAVDQGDDAASWLCKVLGRDGLRLVKLRDDHDRPVDPDYTGGNRGDAYMTGFADGFPFLLISEESLNQLNAKSPAGERLSMDRFRPNIVVRGVDKPFAEDSWKNVQIGPIVFRPVKKCSRCKLTTVDPAKGAFSGPEPLQTLKTFRTDLAIDPKGTSVFFGMNLVAEQKSGCLRVGDAVKVYR